MAAAFYNQTKFTIFTQIKHRLFFLFDFNEASEPNVTPAMV